MLCVCGWVRGEVQHLLIGRAGLLSCVGPVPFASVDRRVWLVGAFAHSHRKKKEPFFFHRSTPTPSSSYRLSVGLDVCATVPGKSAPLVLGVLTCPMHLNVCLFHLLSSHYWLLIRHTCKEDEHGLLHRTDRQLITIGKHPFTH
jgi:hypothetical protein